MICLRLFGPLWITAGSHEGVGGRWINDAVVAVVAAAAVECREMLHR